MWKGLVGGRKPIWNAIFAFESIEKRIPQCVPDNLYIISLVKSKKKSVDIFSKLCIVYWWWKIFILSWKSDMNSKDLEKMDRLASKLEEVRDMLEKKHDFSVSEDSEQDEKLFIKECYDCKQVLLDTLDTLRSIKSEELIGLKSDLCPDANAMIEDINCYLLDTLSIPDKIKNDEEFQKFCIDCKVNHAFLFYKMRINNGFEDFKECERWIYRILISDYFGKDHVDEHILLFDWWDGKLSEWAIDAIIKHYMSTVFIPYFTDSSSWLSGDKNVILNKRKEITKKFKEKYPSATWKCKNMLLSNSVWDQLIADFFVLQDNKIKKRLCDTNLVDSIPNIYDFVEVFALFLNSFLDVERLNSELFSYILNRTNFEFKSSIQKREEQEAEQKRAVLERKQLRGKMDCWDNVPLLTKKKELPDWMEEELVQTEIEDVVSIVKFLRTELTKCWWDIKLSHINDRFERIGEVEKIPDFLVFLENYPDFQVINDIVDDEEEAEEAKELDVWKEKQVVNGWKQLKQELLLKELGEIGDIVDMQDRVVEYVNMFEKLWYQFKNKEDFLNQLVGALEQTQSDGGRLEKSIQSVLHVCIYWWERWQKKYAFWYRVLDLVNGWRLIADNTKQITNIASHDDYMRIINKKPS